MLPLETLYEQGTTAMQKKEYTKAVAAFKDIRDHYPFSPMIEEVALNLADAYYLSYKFIEAASAYEEFATLYPRNKVIPYVLYQMGASHEALFISVDRTIEPLLDASEVFKKLVELYPKTEYGMRAQKRLQFIERKRAEREVYLANFYWRTKKYGAAWLRYSIIIENFKEFDDIVEYATKQAPVAYLRFVAQISKQTQDEGIFQFKDLFNWL